MSNSIAELLSLIKEYAPDLLKPAKHGALEIISLELEKSNLKWKIRLLKKNKDSIENREKIRSLEQELAGCEKLLKEIEEEDRELLQLEEQKEILDAKIAVAKKEEKLREVSNPAPPPPPQKSKFDLLKAQLQEIEIKFADQPDLRDQLMEYIRSKFFEGEE